jgi:hypothetical protein
MSRALVQALSLIAVILTVSTAAQASAPFSPLLSRVHSHNDYEQGHPLFDALKFGIHSVEADIWYQSGNNIGIFEDSSSSSAPAELRVSHIGFVNQGTLRDLYLDPLQKEISTHQGSVFGDGKKFYLWIEFKESDAGLADVLHETLAQFPAMLAKGGPIQVVLTGSERPKSNYVEKYRDFDVVCDTKKPGYLYLAPGPSVHKDWLWYSFSWRSLFKWDGNGPVSNFERSKLREIVARVHQEQRKIRFYFVPETQTVWAESLAAGVDLISSDNLRGMYSYLNSLPTAPNQP